MWSYGVTPNIPEDTTACALLLLSRGEIEQREARATRRQYKVTAVGRKLFANDTTEAFGLTIADWACFSEEDGADHRAGGRIVMYGIGTQQGGVNTSSGEGGVSCLSALDVFKESTEQPWTIKIYGVR